MWQYWTEQEKLALIIAVAIFAVFIIAAALNTPSKGQIVLNEKAEYLLGATLGPLAIKPTVGLYILQENDSIVYTRVTD